MGTLIVQAVRSCVWGAKIKLIRNSGGNKKNECQPRPSFLLLAFYRTSFQWQFDQLVGDDIRIDFQFTFCSYIHTSATNIEDDRHGSAHNPFSLEMNIF